VTTQEKLLDDFRHFYSQLHSSKLNQLDDLYSRDIVFRDPVHEIRGLVALEDYFSSLCSELTDCRFEFLDELKSVNSAYIKWNMHFRHPKLGNRLITVRGVSHLQMGDQVEFHEDFYDMGAMLYDQLPVLGSMTRWLRRRLAT
jgi:esterase/lipase superfamily enzyme